jgi:hypothetical protein
MYRVARRAAFAYGFVLKYKRPALCRVATRARVRLGRMRERAAMGRVALVRIMAVAATHLPFQHGMVIGKVELPAFIEVALKTGFRRLPWVQDGVVRAA